jgi:type VI secretion system secreted protein VgrG
MGRHSHSAHRPGSGCRFRGSKNGGGGYNELRFEDRTDSEEVYFQAQKDLNSLIKNNETRTVDQGNQTITLNKGNQSTVIEKGNQSTEIQAGNQTTKVLTGSITTEAMQSITLKVGANSIVINQSGITLNGLMITIQGQVEVQVAAPMTTVTGSGMMKVTGGIVMIN